MAKHKYDDNRVLDIIGILDVDDDGKVVLNVDDESHNFEEIVKMSLGMEVHYKTQMSYVTEE